MTNAEFATWVKKNPIVVVCGALSLALAGLLYFRGDAIPSANSELEQKSAQARKYELNVTNGAQLKEQLETVSAANQTIAGRLMRASDIGINQQYFYKLEADTGIRLLELSQANRALPRGSFVAIPFTVTIQGSFGQVMAFLRALENSPHYGRVLTASVSGSRDTDVTVGLSLEFLGQP